MKNTINLIKKYFGLYSCMLRFQITMSILVMVTLIATNTSAQILCDLGNREVLAERPDNNEFSGLAHHKERDIFFMPLDDENEDNANIVGYNGNDIFSIPFQNNTALNDNDLEGLTYLEQDYFVLLEEDKNEIYFLQYFPSNQEFKILSSNVTGIPLGTNSDKDGLEGISYDPHTKRLYLVREHFNTELFSIPVTLPGSNSNGSINTNQISSIILPSNIFSDNNSNTDNDAVGLFHLGKVVGAESEISNNLLILSEGLKKVVEFDLVLDAENRIVNLNYLGESSLNLENQPEGIAVYNNELYIASEGDNPIQATLSKYSLGIDVSTCIEFDTNCDCIRYYCQDKIFTEPIADEFYHEAPNRIEGKTNNVIPRDANVVYNSGGKVFLKPGFRASKGSYFRAYIDGCIENIEIENRNGHEPNGVEDNLEVKIYPNPLSQFGNITYELPVDSKVSIMLFDAMGKRVNTLAENQLQQAGQYQLDFNATNLPNGIYYLKLQSNENHIINKLMVTK